MTIHATADRDLKEFSLDFQDLDVASVRVDGRADFTQVEATPGPEPDPRGDPADEARNRAAPVQAAERRPGFQCQGPLLGAPQHITDPDTSIEGWIRACYPLGPPQTCDGAFVVNEPMGAQSWFPLEQLPHG